MLNAVCNIASGSEAGEMKGKKTIHLAEGSDLDWLKTFDGGTEVFCLGSSTK